MPEPRSLGARRRTDVESSAWPRRDQFSGCLVGQALGDALGFLVEGSSPGTCAEYVRTLDAGEPPRIGRGEYPFGQYTDDTQMARELLESLVQTGGFEPTDYAARVARLFTEGRIVGRGRATEEAAHRLAAGVAWHDAGTPSPAAGNGSAMRAAPIGLMFFDDAARLVRAAHDQGRMTHADPRCSAGAVAIAGGVALALRRTEPLAVAEFVETLAEWVAAMDQSVATVVRFLPDLVRQPPEEAIGVIADMGKPSGYHDGWQGISPFVVPSIMWSLYSFLRTPDDYGQTIGTAIAVGGDVDTTAAMAGAISGARLGLAAVPETLARQLNDRGRWTYDDLVRLADEAFALKTRAASPDRG